jgi:hypothetical protein
LAEEIVDGRLTLDEADSALTSVLEALVQGLYSAPHPAASPSYVDTYLHRIRRRAAAIEAAPMAKGETIKCLMRAETVFVNGVECHGLPVLLKILNADSLHNDITILGYERAHGDLILDDIVLSHKGELRLVDPNGEACSRLYDLGKLCLSLTTCYEFFKYGMFECEIKTDRESPSVTVSMRRHPAVRTFVELSERLPAIIADSGMLDGSAHRITPAGLMILNGLQNLALPMFHLLHHGKELRAAAFLAIGLLRVTQGLATLDSGRPASLSDACRCIF